MSARPPPRAAGRERRVHYSPVPLLYLFLFTPLLFRILDSRPTAGEVSIAYLPGLVVVIALEMAKPRMLDEEKEHEVRHAAYLLGFVVALATSVRWGDAARAYPFLVVYAVVGSLTLLWFVASHVVENRAFPSVHTHQGDVVVLPLTLVTIATFSRDVPLTILRAGRAIIFYVPVFVAWATLNLIAYNDFSRLRTTTLNHRFNYCVLLSLPVATAHLALVETGAQPALYLLLTFTAAFLAQIAYPVSSPAILRARGWTGFLVVALLVSSLPPLAVFPHLPGNARTATAELTLVYTYCFTFLAAIVPRIAGESWPVALSLYVTTFVVAYVYRDGDRREEAEPFFPLFSFALTLFAAPLVQALCGEVTAPVPPTFEPGLVLAVCPPTLRWEATDGEGHTRGERPPGSVPAALSGVWKCVGTTSRDLSVDGIFLSADTARGKEEEDGTTLLRWSELRRYGDRRPSLAQRAFDSASRVRVYPLTNPAAKWRRCETESWCGVGPVGIAFLRRTVWIAAGQDGGDTVVVVRLDKNDRMARAWRYSRRHEG